MSEKDYARESNITALFSAFHVIIIFSASFFYSHGLRRMQRQKSLLSEDQQHAIMDQEIETEKGNLIGMILIAIGLCFWTLMTGIISWKNDISTVQFVISQYIITFIISILIYCFKPPISNKRIHFCGESIYEVFILSMHGITQFAMIYFYYYSLKWINLGDSIAIRLILFIPFIGRLFFNESLPKYITLFIVISLIGALMVIQPSFIPIFHEEDELSYTGLIFILISCISSCISVLLISRYPDIHWTQFQIGSGLIAIIIFLPLLYTLNYCNCLSNNNNNILGGQFQFDKNTIVICCCFGFGAYISSSCLIIGYKMVDNAKVVWLEYVNLIFAYGIQWIIFKQIRNMYEVIGAVIILSTVLIQFYRQYNDIQTSVN